jgi:glycosyltransferase involved in cell wall biosynthesis
MRFSIVIPLHRPTPAFDACLAACLTLDHADFEVLVVSDRPAELPADPRVVSVVTGLPDDSSPAEKRDAALPHATGAAIAYLDDDAEPAPDWLRVAEAAFEDPEVAALGGPGVTPPGGGWRRRVGGAVYESALGSGPLRYRFAPAPARVVDDYPAYNLIVRTEAVRRAGGWASTFYGGEDTRFCEELARIGVRVNYLPELVVRHHRRPVFRAHMRQVGNVGRHRGHFVRKHPETSRRLVYFAPIAALVAAPLALAAGLARLRPGGRAAALGALYAGLAASSPAGGARERLAFPLALTAHHAAYGASFVAGLLTRRMDR